jgi:uncharacterized protein YjbI with pentapeptide repeats
MAPALHLSPGCSFVLCAIQMTHYDAGKSSMNLTSALLCRANLADTDLRQANLLRADLCWANLTKANMERARLYEANLVKARLPGALLHQADLSRQNELWQPVQLLLADLRGAELVETSLVGADLRGANLRGACLERANLAGVDLEKADLRKARLDQTNLHGANLRKAKLKGAILSGVVLTEARVTTRQLAKTKSMVDGVLPGRKDKTSLREASRDLIRKSGNALRSSFQLLIGLLEVSVVLSAFLVFLAVFIGSCDAWLPDRMPLLSDTFLGTGAWGQLVYKIVQAFWRLAAKEPLVSILAAGVLGLFVILTFVVFDRLEDVAPARCGAFLGSASFLIGQWFQWARFPSSWSLGHPAEPTIAQFLYDLFMVFVGLFLDVIPNSVLTRRDGWVFNGWLLLLIVSSVLLGLAVTALVSVVRRRQKSRNLDGLPQTDGASPDKL